MIPTHLNKATFATTTTYSMCHPEMQPTAERLHYFLTSAIQLDTGQKKHWWWQSLVRNLYLLSLFLRTRLNNALQTTTARLTITLQMLLLLQTVPDIIFFTPNFCKVIEMGNAKKKIV